MKATHTDQLDLLELQKLDQKESALRHKRDSHPAHATVREFAGRVADLQRAAISQNAVISDTGREVRRIEEEIAKVCERRSRQQGRIDANLVPLRDISAMEHEIAQMDRRLAKLEDGQVDAEERVETARAAQEKIKADFQADVAEADDELRRVIAARRELTDRLPSDLLNEYEEARRRNGALAVIEVRDGYGIGVAADLSPMELERIRLTPADEVYLTEETAQIVVRTAENTPR